AGHQLYMEYFRGLLGIIALLGVAFIFSTNRKLVDWRLVGIGVLIQAIFGVLITKVDFVADLFLALSRGFVKFLSFSQDGAIFLFGDLASNTFGFIFAFQVLPTRSEEHTSELQSRENLVCRLLLG